MIYKDINKENLELFSLIIIAVIVIYFVPYPINNIIFLLVLPIVWKSRRDYFWIAFFFIINDYPGGLFHGGERADIYRLPIYNLTGKISFTISELFFLLIFYKTIKKAKENGPYYNAFKNEFILLVILFILLVLVSFPLGLSMQSLRNVYKIIIGILLFYSLYRYFNNLEKLTSFLNLVFPFAFIAIALQLYSLITKQQLIALFKPGVIAVRGVLGTNPGLGTERPIELVHVLFICFSGSLLLLNSKENIFNKNYLLFVSILSYLSIIMTATRSWVLAFTAGYILFFLGSIRNISNIFRFGFVFALISIFILYYEPTILSQIESALDRIFTLKALISGDITAEGTLRRLDVRRPALIKAFANSSIIFGSGFSDHYFDNEDGHLGYHNLLFNTGIVGVILFLYFFFRIFALVIQKKEINKIVLLPIIMLLIINAGSQTIGFTIDYIRIIVFSLCLVIVNLAVKKI